MNPTNEVVAYAQTTIEFSAKSLIGKCGICKADLEDIESEMMLDVLQRLPQHDSAQWSYKTFIPHIVKNKSSHILRSRCAEKEFLFRNAQSLDAPCTMDAEGGNESLTLHDIVSAESVKSNSCMSNRERGQLRIDLAGVMSSLSEIQQQCCQAIMNEEPILQIAQDQGMPRSTFYKHVIFPIREAFAKAGFEEYLK